MHSVWFSPFILFIATFEPLIILFIDELAKPGDPFNTDTSPDTYTTHTHTHTQSFWNVLINVAMI